MGVYPAPGRCANRKCCHRYQRFTLCAHRGTVACSKAKGATRAPTLPAPAMPIILPFEAFARDAAALNVEEDESRIPVRWLAAAQVAFNLSNARPNERAAFIRTWSAKSQLPDKDGEVWHALTVPGIAVRDLSTAAATLCAIGDIAEEGGALNLAYSIVTNVRIALLEGGPAAVRDAAAIRQARVLGKMGMSDEMLDTYEAARDDAVRGGDRELEALAVAGIAEAAKAKGEQRE